MSVTDELLAHNEAYAADFDGPLPLPPAKGLAVVACMDARLDVYASEAFPDLDQDVRDSVARITGSPYVPHTDQVRGFVFDVATGRLREVA